MHSAWLTYRKKRFFHCNLSHLSEDEFEQEIIETERLIYQQPQFAEVISRISGQPFMVFHSTEDAESWLTQK